MWSFSMNQSPKLCLTSFRLKTPSSPPVLLFSPKKKDPRGDSSKWKETGKNLLRMKVPDHAQKSPWINATWLSTRLTCPLLTVWSLDSYGGSWRQEIPETYWVVTQTELSSFWCSASIFGNAIPFTQRVNDAVTSSILPARALISLELVSYCRSITRIC